MCTSYAAGGVYSSQEPCPFPIRPDGTAFELSFNPDKSGRFKTELARFELMLNSARTTPDREAVLARLAGPQAPADRAADLLRTGNPDEAVNVLQPHARRADFAVLMNLAHATAARGEWADAVRRHADARLDAEFPSQFPGITPPQRTWLQRIEKEFYPKWLSVHRQRAESRTSPETEDVFPLFAVSWANTAGAYEPGQLAPSEKAKLPPDAIAIVQQLLLWSPTDTQLLWLLAELYAAEGRLAQADILFDDCVWSRSFSNRRVLMAHREAVKRAIAALPPPEPPPAATLDDIGLNRTNLILFGTLFGGGTVVLLGFQLRAFLRRRKAS